MLSKCSCGTYTDFGTICVSCLLLKADSDVELDIDVEDYIEDEIHAQ